MLPQFCITYQVQRDSDQCSCECTHTYTHTHTHTHFIVEYPVHYEIYTAKIFVVDVPYHIVSFKTMDYFYSHLNEIYMGVRGIYSMTQMTEN